jgi:hypothetical protein
MLSSSIYSLKILLLCFTFLFQCLILWLSLLKVCISFNTHNFDLLVSINHHFLCCCLCIIYLCNSISFYFIHNNLLKSFSLSNLNWSLFFSFYYLDFHLSLCFYFSLIFIDFCSFNLLFKLIHLSLIVSLKSCKFLLLFIFNS